MRSRKFFQLGAVELLYAVISRGKTVARLTRGNVVAAALAAFVWSASSSVPEAQASLILGTTADQFAVLGQFSNNQTNFNNGTITGDVGIGSPREFTISNASVVGNIRFSGAVSTAGLSGGPIPGPGPYTVSGGGTVSGGVVANDAAVTNAINYTNDLSQFLGGQSGTSKTVATGGSITASSGTPHTGTVDGNLLGNYFVFTVSSVNFPNGIFTINGSATDQVVLDLGFSANLHGQIVLAGGITSDDVVINMFGGNDTTHMGGPTLDVNTNGLITMGTFLDPNGAMSAGHTTIDGRFFGGDVQNQQIVSGANIIAPPVLPQPAPEPATLALLGLGLAGLSLSLRKRR